MNKQIPIIIPAYEPDEKMILLLEKLKQANLTEVIIVDDGSKDKTKEVAWEYVKRYNNSNIRVLVEYHNRGKGGAIRMVWN